jgi:hypothetical protein
MPVDHASVRQQLRVPMSAAVLLLLAGAFGRRPYGFYQILRLVVCGAAAYGGVVFAPVSRLRDVASGCHDPVNVYAGRSGVRPPGTPTTLTLAGRGGSLHGCR